MSLRRLWLALAASLMLLVPLAPAATATVDPTPTVPQNLRANYVNGVFDSMSWDPSTMEGGGPIWYHIDVYYEGGGGGTLWENYFFTTQWLSELVGSAYLEYGKTYTFSIAAVGHSGGKNRKSGNSNLLTVRFPDQQPW